MLPGYHPYQALARVAMFKAMPSDALLLECKASSAAHFFKQARSLLITPSSQCQARSAAHLVTSSLKVK